MLKSYIFIALIFTSVEGMSPEEYRQWFRTASTQEIQEQVVKPFFRHPLRADAYYQQLLDNEKTLSDPDQEFRDDRCEFITYYGITAVIGTSIAFLLAHLSGQL